MRSRYSPAYSRRAGSPGYFGFDAWCGDRLCHWTLEKGEIRRVSTWHAGDDGVELVEPERLRARPGRWDMQRFAFDVDRWVGVTLVLHKFAGGRAVLGRVYAGVTECESTRDDPGIR